jgi:hypothetical protein
MLTRYDRNRDGKLDADEIARYRWGNLREADRSGDGNVSQDELAAWLLSRAQGSAAATATASPAPAATAGPAPAPPASPAPASVAPANRAAAAVPSEPARKSYRFLSALERLPPGLPSWFREKDRDKDGQVMMSEWTTQWSDAAVAEFSSHDRNGDGVITPAEALRSGR